MNAGADRFAAIRDRLRALLEGERQRLQDEIRAYPTPIPRCDQQFNHLIAQREALSAQWARLDPLTPASFADARASWDAFIAAADLDPEFKRQLQAALGPTAMEESPGVAGG